MVVVQNVEETHFKTVVIKTMMMMMMMVLMKTPTLTLESIGALLDVFVNSKKIQRFDHEIPK